MSDWLVSCIITTGTVIFTVVVWEAAHWTVATECKKLGAFYVGETVFECKVREGK